VRVVGTVEPDVEIANDVDGHLVGGGSIENVSQLVKELLLHRLGAGSIKNDDDDGRTSNSSLSTDELKGGRLSDGSWRQTDVGGGHDEDATMVDRQVVVIGLWTQSVDDVLAGAAQTTEDGAVGVVPRFGETQQVDSTVTTQLDDVNVLAQK